MINDNSTYLSLYTGAMIALCTACGSSSSANNQPADAAASNDQHTPGAICNGEDTVRFAYRFVGGGVELPGKRVLSENGYEFLLIDGQCRYWALKSQYSDVRYGELAVSEASELEGALRLSTWADLQGEYSVSLCDGTAPWLRFAEMRIRIHAACGGPGNANPVIWLQDVVRGHLAQLYERGRAFEGPVRLVLVTEAADVAWPPLVEQAKATWAASEDPARWATTVSEAQKYEPGSSRQVEGRDAQLLREVKRTFYEGGGVSYTGGFVPIAGPRGERYQLYLRDSIPLEDATGLLHVD